MEGVGGCRAERGSRWRDARLAELRAGGSGRVQGAVGSAWGTSGEWGAGGVVGGRSAGAGASDEEVLLLHALGGTSTDRPVSAPPRQLSAPALPGRLHGVGATAKCRWPPLPEGGPFFPRSTRPSHVSNLDKLHLEGLRRQTWLVPSRAAPTLPRQLSRATRLHHGVEHNRPQVPRVVAGDAVLSRGRGSVRVHRSDRSGAAGGLQPHHRDARAARRAGVVDRRPSPGVSAAGARRGSVGLKRSRSAMHWLDCSGARFTEAESPDQGAPFLRAQLDQVTCPTWTSCAWEGSRRQTWLVPPPAPRQLSRALRSPAPPGSTTGVEHNRCRWPPLPGKRPFFQARAIDHRSGENPRAPRDGGAAPPAAPSGDGDMSSLPSGPVMRKA